MFPNIVYLHWVKPPKLLSYRVKWDTLYGYNVGLETLSLLALLYAIAVKSPAFTDEQATEPPRAILGAPTSKECFKLYVILEAS